MCADFILTVGLSIVFASGVITLISSLVCVQFDFWVGGNLGESGESGLS